MSLYCLLIFKIIIIINNNTEKNEAAFGAGGGRDSRHHETQRPRKRKQQQQQQLRRREIETFGRRRRCQEDKLFQAHGKDLEGCVRRADDLLRDPCVVPGDDSRDRDHHIHRTGLVRNPTNRILVPSINFIFFPLFFPLFFLF